MLAILIALTLVALAAIAVAFLLARELIRFLLEEREDELNRHRLDLAGLLEEARVERAVVRADLNELVDAAREERQLAEARAIQERHALLERIQRPQQEPFAVEVDGPDLNLTRSEDDEIVEQQREMAALVEAELAARQEFGLT